MRHSPSCASDSAGDGKPYLYSRAVRWPSRWHADRPCGMHGRMRPTSYQKSLAKKGAGDVSYTMNMRAGVVGCALLAAGAYCAYGEAQQFVVGQPSAHYRLNPQISFTTYEAQLYTAIYEGLVGYNPLTLEPEPAVAERWEVSENGLTYRFFLREDARYWNGDAVVAEHFRDTWLALLGNEEAHYSVLFDIIEGAQAFRNGDNSDPQSVGIVAVNATQLDIHLVAPNPQLLSILCHYSFSPLHPRMLRLRAGWERFPLIVSNGPYLLDNSRADRLTLLPNPQYWDADAIGFDSIEVRFIDDSAELAEGFLDRAIDWVPAGIGEDAHIFGDALQVNPLFGTNFYFFRTDSEPWSDSRVRKALALLIPWDEVRAADYYIYPTSSLVPPFGNYSDADGITGVDTEMALALLDEAGYPNGRDMPSAVIMVPDNPEDRRVAELIQDSWEGVLDIEVDIRFVENREYYGRIAEEEFTLGRISWIGDYLDPLAFLELWKSDSNLNEARYANAEFDMHLQRAALTEGQERLDILHSAEQHILNDAVILPINHSVALNIIDTERIGGWFRNVLDIHPFKGVTLSTDFVLPNIAAGH